MMNSDALPKIDLAMEPPFRMGDLEIDPSRRKISSADGSEQSIEPKLLQVLLLLYRKRNTPVSRNELLACCWGGRFVSGDAIERVISRLRRLEAELAPGSFRIVTINKIGYELGIEEHAPLLTERLGLKQGFFPRLSLTAMGARKGIIAAFAITGLLASWLAQNYFVR